MSVDDPLVGSDPFGDRLRATPVPAVVWVLGVLVLLGLQAGRIGPGIASLGVELVTATTVAVAWIALAVAAVVEIHVTFRLVEALYA